MMDQGLPLFRALMLRALLLLSLLLSGMVPDGMMRQAGADGMQLVLCTPDGPQEVWLSEDGEVTPVAKGGGAPSDHDQGHKPHCVQVSMVAQDAALPVAVPVAARLRPAVFARFAHQVPRSRGPVGAHRTRAPPEIA